MKLSATLATAIIVTAAGAAQAAGSALILGKSSYGANCAVCHGEDGTGSGAVTELFRTPPSDLTTLSERSGGAFPFAEVYQSIASGPDQKAHGESEMLFWGGYFVADTLADRGVSAADADHIFQGRFLSLAYYLESIQK